MPDPRDSVLEGRGRAAGEVAAYTGDYLQRRSAQIDREALQAIRSPEGLSPDKALQLWLQKAEVISFVQAMDRDMTLGNAARERVAPPPAEKLPLP